MRLLENPQSPSSLPVEFSMQNPRRRNLKLAHSSFSFTPGSFIAGRDCFVKSWKRCSHGAVRRAGCNSESASTQRGGYSPTESLAGIRAEARAGSDHVATDDVALRFAGVSGAVRQLG